MSQDLETQWQSSFSVADDFYSPKIRTTVKPMTIGEAVFSAVEEILG